MKLARKKGWIGVDLGPGSLKLVQVERTGIGMRIGASVVMPRIRPSTSEPDAVARESEWTSRDILAALSLKPGLSGRRAACVLPMCVTDLNVLKLPSGGIGERRAMVSHELSSMFTGQECEREFDFWEAAPAATSNPRDTKDVNVLSVSRRLTSQVARDLSGARLRCEVIDGLPFALARAVKLAYASGPAAPVGAVDWGFASATFCVASGAKPLFTRHLRSCGASPLLAAVSEALGLSETEAMQILAGYGLPGPERGDGELAELQEVIAEVGAEPLSEMVEELNKTISYLRMQYAGILPERLCLFGEGATIRNVTTFLSKKVGLPIDVWRLPHLENHTREDSGDHPALLGTAAALSALAWA